MKRSEINIRDPFVLTWDGKYYMYGTRGETAFAKYADGIDVYTGTDLEKWDGPIEVFHRPLDFWADRCFWAPEVHTYQGQFYMFATFAVGNDRMGTSVLRADSPLGPFVPIGYGTLTPEDWRCLDGTLYVKNDGTPYLVFSREWKQVKDGQICAMRLSSDLSAPAGEPFILFHASDGRPAVHAFLFNRWVTDGPFLIRTEDGRLHMLWSSMGKRNAYIQALAHSDSDEIDGHWTVDQELLFKRDGGHGMIFKTLEGQYMLTLHSPNKGKLERPVFWQLDYGNGKWKRI